MVPGPELNVRVELGVTSNVPLSDTFPQGPVVVTVKLKLPDCVGVPEMVKSLVPPLYVPVTPVGNEPAVIEAPVPLPPTR